MTSQLAMSRVAESGGLPALADDLIMHCAGVDTAFSLWNIVTSSKKRLKTIQPSNVNFVKVQRVLLCRDEDKKPCCGLATA